MVKSCVRSFNWTPHYCERLYIDCTDVYGLEYWHNDAKEVENGIKEARIKAEENNE